MAIHRGIRTPKLAVGDRIRVRETEEAVAAGVADRVGDIVELATQPVTDVSLIGATSEGHAVKVSFADKEGTFWFAKEQLEFLEHVPGAMLKSAGADPEASHDASRESGETVPAETKPKPWWKFGRG